MGDNLQHGENYAVRDISLAESGALRVDWARSRMPVLGALREEALKTKPLAGMRVAGCLHVTKETAVLIETIVAAGAEISWSGCNPLSTHKMMSLHGLQLKVTASMHGMDKA